MSKQETRKTLSELGKFPLADHLAAQFIPQNDTTFQGIGDDAAVGYYLEPLTVSAQQLMMEGVDFDLTYFPLKFIGYKAAVGAMGRIMAMNAQPMQLLASVGVSQRFFVDDIDNLFSGVKAACQRYGVDLSSIDVKSSFTGLSVCITAVGQAQPGTLARRSGAQENDLICLSGNVGAAYMGLQLLEREKRVFTGKTDKDDMPKLEGYEYILERYLKPELPSALLANLRQDDLLPTAMCLLDNGLAQGILSVCQASGMGAKLFLEKIPIARQSFEFAKENEEKPVEGSPLIDPIVAALNGGDDYEILFTLPLSQYEQLSKDYSIDVIGHICSAQDGCVLVTPQGQSLHIEAPGMKGNV